MMDTLLDNLGVSGETENSIEIDSELDACTGGTATDSSLFTSESINSDLLSQQASLAENPLVIGNFSIAGGGQMDAYPDVSGLDDQMIGNSEYQKNSFMMDSHTAYNSSFDYLEQDIGNEIQSTDFILPDEMVVRAVERACDFFHLPEVPVVNSEGSCVWPNDPGTPFDDVFGFNRTELMELGIRGEDSLTLVYTHECAHRALQSYPELDPWEHELACDFFAGIHAGMEGIDTDNFEEALGSTHGSASHPVGSLRSDFIEYGKEVAEEMQARNIPVTLEGCLERFNAHLIEEENTIVQCRQNADCLITSENGEEHPLGFVDDKAWHEKQARENFDNANWHRKEAEKATERGDYAAAKDHISRANSYDSTGKYHMKAASSCSKSYF